MTTFRCHHSNFVSCYNQYFYLNAHQRVLSSRIDECQLIIIIIIIIYLMMKFNSLDIRKIIVLHKYIFCRHLVLSIYFFIFIFSIIFKRYKDFSCSIILLGRRTKGQGLGLGVIFVWQYVIILSSQNIFSQFFSCTNCFSGCSLYQHMW